jgi:hypothetical protein
VDNAAFYDDTSTWHDRRGYTLSDRIWANRQALRARIDAIIRQGILDGATVEDVAGELVRYVNPSYARNGHDGKARYAASRLAGNEMRRAHALGTQATAMTDPAGGYLRYTVSAGHIEQDECDTRANHDEGFGRGVYRAKECPLPPEHPGCRCSVSEVGVRTDDMAAFVEQLRVEYGLEDPPDMSPAELVTFRRETGAIREAVQVMFQTWFQQVGLVSREQLLETSPTVKDWVESVRAEKQRRRGR